MAAHSTPWVRTLTRAITFTGSIRLANRPAYNFAVGNELKTGTLVSVEQ